MFRKTLAFIFVLIVGCSGDSDSPSPVSQEPIPSPPPELVAIDIEFERSSVFIYQTYQFAANGTLSDGSTVDLTQDVTWSSSDEAIAIVDDAGMVSALEYGDAAIAAQYQNIEASWAITVASDAETSLTLDDNGLHFRWKSQFNSELGYSIQKKSTTVSDNESSAWETVAQSGPVSIDSFGTVIIENATGTYRIVANLENSDPITLAASSGTTEFKFDQSTATELVIVPLNPEPIYQDNAIFGLSGPALSANWYVNTKAACYRNECAENSITLDTSLYSNGTNRLDAAVEVEADVFVYTNLSINIYNPNLTLSLDIQNHPNDATLLFGSNVTSSSAIEKVEFYVDDNLVASLTEEAPIWSFNYHYLWPKEHGEHVIKVTATNTEGLYQETTSSTLVDTVPHLIMSNPLPGEMIVDNSLTITGTVSYVNESVTTRTYIGDIQVGEKTGTGDFSFSYSLEGLLEEASYVVRTVATNEFNTTEIHVADIHYHPSMDGKVEVVYKLPPPNRFQIWSFNDDQMLATYDDDRPEEYTNLLADFSDPTPAYQYISSETYSIPHLNSKGYYADTLNGELYINRGQGNEDLSLFFTNGTPDGELTFEGKMLLYFVRSQANNPTFYIWDSESLAFEVLELPFSIHSDRELSYSHNDKWLCVGDETLGGGAYVHQFNSGGTWTKISDGYDSCMITTNSNKIYRDRHFVGNDSDDLVALSSSLYSIETGEIIQIDLSGGKPSYGFGQTYYSDGIMARDVWSSSGVHTIELFDTQSRTLENIENAELYAIGHGKILFYRESGTDRPGLYLWRRSTKESEWVWPSSTSPHAFFSPNYTYLVHGNMIHRID